MSADKSGRFISRYREGLGEITDVGEGVKGLEKSDWVVFGKDQSGTWSSGQILEEGI